MARSFAASSPAGTCPVGQAACRISRVAQGGLQDTALFVPTRWQARRATQEKSTGWWLTRWKISYRITWMRRLKVAALVRHGDLRRTREAFAIRDTRSAISNRLNGPPRLVQNKNLVEDYLQLFPNKIETRMFSTAL